MKQINKTLGICLLVTALVYGVLKILGGAGFGDRAKGDTKVSSRDSITRHERGENASDVSTRKFRQRARKLTSAEASEFLKTTIIPEIDFENIKLEDALKIVNEEIAKQTPDDQARPRILLHPNYLKQLDQNMQASIDRLPGRSMIGRRFVDIHERQITVLSLMQLICDQTHSRFWLYKGDYYLSSIYGDPNDGGIGYSFYYSEKLNRVNLENIDASQLSLELNKIIEQHEYFGPKKHIDIMMTKKARNALLKGEVKLPRINLDLENTTLKQAMIKIEEHTGGALALSGESLIFNPFHEVHNTDPFAAVGEGGSFDIILNEDAMNPKFVPAEDPFE